MRRLLLWVKRGAIGAVAGLAGLALVGAMWQAWATAADHRNFPLPGKLVDVGGHRLHIHCTGKGSPTVVLETGAMGMSALWGWVQAQVAPHTRVCSYDRAGLGWSETGPEPRDAQRIAQELHTLLKNAGESPPFVLVGHSYGGLLIRMYADQYPEEVTGLLFLDSSHPDQAARFEKVEGKPQSFLIERVLFSPALARLGFPRFLVRFTSIMNMFFDGLPPRQEAEAKAFVANSTHFSAGMAEMLAWEESTGQVRASRYFGDLPLIVVSAGEQEGAANIQAAWYEMHRELAALSTHGTHRIIAGATHTSLVTSREHAAQVAEGIRELIEAARAATEKK